MSEEYEDFERDLVNDLYTAIERAVADTLSEEGLDDEGLIRDPSINNARERARGV